MSMNPDSYTNSFGKRLRILLSPVRVLVFVAAIVICVIGNVIYINNGAGPEWLGLSSVIPLFAFTTWSMVTDAKMRRLDREGVGESVEVSTSADLDSR
jgi:hypothetical protein